MAPRDISVGAGRGGIAVADREQPVGDGMAAARMTALAAAAPDVSGRAPQRAHDRPQQDGRDNGDAERQREYRDRRLGVPTAP